MMVELSFHQVLKQVASGAKLSREQAERAFLIIMNGGATPAQIAGFLMAIKMRGETVDEITGGAAVLRVKAPKFNAPTGTMDTCGTGGDAKGSYNISTASAFVLGACGVPVAKHGNRSVSSKSGSADVLTALGVKIDASIPLLERCLREVGMCFLMAPQFHPAMRHVAPVRQELGVRTIFNILGPLANPAHPELQLLGVYEKSLLAPMVEVLKQLGVKRAWVVHGSDGMDEITITGKTHVAALNNGEITTFEVSPEDAGLECHSSEALKGGDAGTNAQALREVLLGSKSAYRDAVLINTAAALIIAEKATNLREGVTMATEAIDSGKAYKLLQTLIDASHARE
jgi:anthranilate phosphoribosyltransferase